MMVDVSKLMAPTLWWDRFTATEKSRSDPQPTLWWVDTTGRFRIEHCPSQSRFSQFRAGRTDFLGRYSEFQTVEEAMRWCQLQADEHARSLAAAESKPDREPKPACEPQWHPIETAPRDGTHVLISMLPLRADDRVATEAFWKPDPHNPASGVWLSFGDRRFADKAIHGVGASHWTPMPETP